MLGQTLGDLKRSGFCPVSVKDEMRANLIRKLEAGEALFPGILGYEDTVVPQLVNAILKDFLAEGEQPKTLLPLRRK